MNPEVIEKLSLDDDKNTTTTADRSIRDDNEGSVASSALHIDISSGYPFLCDKETVAYVKKSKVMFIMRGPPGSGKSSLVRKLNLLYPEIVVCSADAFFYKEDGTYFRDAERLSSAHEFSKVEAEKAVSDRKLHIAIDNTNIRAWEMKPYFSLASQGGYAVFLVVPCTSWAFNPVQLAKFNIHGVPVEDILAKIDKFEEVFPCYWGWSLNDENSEEMRTMAVKYFNECVLHIPEFSSYLPMREDESNPSFSDVYSTGLAHLHCTSFFVGKRKSNERVRSYARSKTVTDSVGMVSKLMVTGIVYTPRTAGLRVALAGCQVDLFVENDDESASSVGNSADDDVSATKQHKRKKLKGRSNLQSTSPPMVEKKTDDHHKRSPRNSQVKSSTLRKTGNVHAKDAHELAESAVCAKSDSPKTDEGLRKNPHVTLGFSSTSQASQTGRDLLDVIAYESQSNSGNIERIILDEDQVSIGYYGEGRCVVAFRQPFSVNALFSGFY